MNHFNYLINYKLQIKLKNIYIIKRTSKLYVLRGKKKQKEKVKPDRPRSQDGDRQLAKPRAELCTKSQNHRVLLTRESANLFHLIGETFKTMS